MDAKNVAFAALITSVLIMLVNPFRITSFSILDTDPSTYIIVPIIMLPVFLVFIAKLKIKPEPRTTDIAIGSVMFLLFILAIVYLKSLLMLGFLEFRVDMLLMPLALSGLVTILFGARNISKFKAPLIYILFASPLLLMPAINLNSAFAQFNTLMVYSILHAFISNVSYTPPVSISIGTNILGIGESCAGVGVLIGIIFFITPIAWFYKGKVSSKVYWIMSGFFLLFLLNIIRMSSIAGIWLAYGSSATVSYVHAFAGILLFYAAIIIIFFLLPKYGLTSEIAKKGKGRKHLRSVHSNYIYYSIAIAIILSILYYVISLNYLPSLSVSPVYGVYTGNISLTNPAISGMLSKITGMPGYESETLATANNATAIVFVLNTSKGSTSEMEFMVTGTKYDVVGSTLHNATILGKYAFVNTTGTEAKVFYFLRNGSRFYLVDTFVLYESGTGYAEAAAYAVMYSNNTAVENSACNSSYDHIYTAILNAMYMNFYNSKTVDNMTHAYCFLENLVN